MDTEVKVPAGLLAAGVAVYVLAGLLAAGPAGAAATLVAIAIQVVFGVVFGLVALFLCAKLLGMAFGSFHTAVLKLAAVIVFPTAVAFFIPSAPLAWLVSVLLYVGLLSWLFDLDAWEVVVCAIVIWLVQFVAAIAGGLVAAA